MDRADLSSREEGPFEQARYIATLDACGPGPFRSALELGGSMGVFTELLAPRCARLTTIDVSRTAATMARRRLAGLPEVEVVRGRIPEDIPGREYDLIVAGEILYHLDQGRLEQTLAVIRARLAPGGRLVVAHWRPSADGEPFSGGGTRARLREEPELVLVRGEQTPGYVLDVLERIGG